METIEELNKLRELFLCHEKAAFLRAAQEQKVGETWKEAVASIEKQIEWNNKQAALKLGDKT